MSTGTTRRRGRPSGATGAELLDVARDLFLERGYPGATMDEVASRARISKVSLYREHASKAALFAAVVRGWATDGRDAMRPALERLVAEPDVRAGLTSLGETMRRAILSPAVMRMRGLVASEAGAQPEVAALYLRESWDRNIDGLADGLQTLHRLGRLRLSTDARSAADHFTWLVLGRLLNEQMLTGRPVEEDWESLTSAVALFLAGHGHPAGR